LPLLAPELATVLTFPRPDAAWVEVGLISVANARRQRRLNLPKLNTLVFPETSDCATDRSSSNCVGEPRCGSLVILSKVLLCSHFDRKVRQHILMTPMGNRSSPTMAHYGVGIYNNNAIMTSFYDNSEVRYTNYFPTPQVYNTNVVDGSHIVMHMSSSHVNMHNSYSSTDMSRWSNYNAYIFEHISNIHNGFIPPYSSTEPVSHCAPQTHMSMSNYYSRADMRALTDFDQSLYTTPYSIRMEIAPNIVSSPPVASNAFHSATPIYSRVEESLANTLTSSTNRSNIDKGSNTELTIEDLPVEYRRKFEAINMKIEEAFMARYDVTSQGLVLQDTEPFAFDIYKVVAEEEITAERNNSSDDVQSSDCIYVPSGNRLASILGPYPTANSKVKSQDSDDIHNSKTSVVEDLQEDLANNGIVEETIHPASNIDMAEPQASLRLVQTR
jgi:hypothetical protein